MDPLGHVPLLTSSYLICQITFELHKTLTFDSIFVCHHQIIFC